MSDRMRHPGARIATRIGAALGVTLAALLGSLPAAWADGAVTDASAATVELTWTGSVSSTSFDGQGESEENEPYDVSMTLLCDDAGCVWGGTATWAFPPDELPVAIVDSGTASGEWSWEESGDACSDTDPYRGSGTGSIVATATGAHLEFTTDASGWRPCADGSQALIWGIEGSMDGDLVSGDPCVLTWGPSCAATAEPSVGDGPATSSRSTSLSALPTPGMTLSPAQVAAAVVTAVVLIILMALPTALMNSAVESGSPGVRRWWAEVAARSSAPAFLGRWARAVRGAWARIAAQGSGVLVAAVTVFIAALISAFIQPGFGTSLASWRMLLSLAIGFALDVVLGWFVLIWLMRRLNPEATPRFETRPETLLIVLAAVAFTRISGFQPGIVFGLVAGVVFGTVLATAARAKVALVTLAWGLLLGIVAWIAYALIAPGAADDPSGVLVFLDETLAAITVAGISALPIALVPLRGLSGHALWTWNRWIWAAAYGVGLIAFFLVLMPMPYAWGQVNRSLVAWIVAYVIYAAIAVAVWLVVVRPWRRTPAEDTAATAAGAETEAPAPAD